MYRLFTDNKIKPTGWLRRQLETEARGLVGNLDRIWGDIADSSWIGGDCEGWERVPYWLDGYIPLAYMLEDPVMLRVVERYITAIIKRRDEDGWICPCEKDKRKEYDLWAYILVCKVLALYLDFAGDRAAEDAECALYDALKYLHGMLKDGHHLKDWGKLRWFEGLIPLLWLRERYSEEWITETAEMFRRDGTDFYSLKDLWREPATGWTYERHIVNIAMMFKYEALCTAMFGDSPTGEVEDLWQHLCKYHGNAVGAINGDECLAGPDNNHGFELCSVCELMYSCEVIYGITGDVKWADRLERLAFNALPATISDDMWTHQYDQQVNQVACIIPEDGSFFTTNRGRANMFGLEPEYGCCTANMAQGWPKLVMNVFHETERGIMCSMMLPAVLECDTAKVEIVTEYPFRHTATYIVESDAEFELSIRIPAWAKSVTVNGEVSDNRGIIRINKKWQGREEITVSLTDTPHLVRRDGGLSFAEYGALVYSMPIEWEKKYVFEKGLVRGPWEEYELHPKEHWGFGFADDTFEVVERDGSGFSSTDPSVVLTAKLAPVEWNFVEGFAVAKTLPESTEPVGEAKERVLHPYGATMLRLTEMPMIGE